MHDESIIIISFLERAQLNLESWSQSPVAAQQDAQWCDMLLNMLAIQFNGGGSAWFLDPFWLMIAIYSPFNSCHPLVDACKQSDQCIWLGIIVLSIAGLIIAKATTIKSKYMYMYM